MHWSEELFASFVAVSLLAFYVIRSHLLHHLKFRSACVYGTAFALLLLSHFYPDNTIALLTATLIQVLESFPPFVLAPIMILIFILSHSRAAESKQAKSETRQGLTVHHSHPLSTTLGEPRTIGRNSTVRGATCGETRTNGISGQAEQRLKLMHHIRAIPNKG